MLICGQDFTAQLLSRIKGFIRGNPGESRRSLSRRVCELMDWRSLNGKLQEMSCRKALAKLDKKGMIELPEIKGTWTFQKESKVKDSFIPEHGSVSCPLEELGVVEVVPVFGRRSPEFQQWKGLLNTYHYLGSGPLCGSQIRYVIKSDRYGLLGGLSFSAPAWRLSARDEYIGWTENAHRENLQRVVCNSRFLIVPSVKVPNLASHVLSLVLKQLGSDWERRYGYRPALAETFVETGRFSGTLYKASNWINVGSSVGRGRQGIKKEGHGVCKAIYLRGLVKNWKQILCRTSTGEVIINKKGPPKVPIDWAEEEFMKAEFGDQRLNKRLPKLARLFYSKPGALIPEVCGNASSANTAYRFFKNKRIDMDKILSPHYESTVKRMKNYDVVLAVQDTSSLNYSTLKATMGLGPINTKKDKALGLELHDTMAFTTEGIPLGLLDVQCWARDANESAKKDKKIIPIEEKESFKWIKSYRSVSRIQKECSQTRIVSVGDREADIYELFSEKHTEKGGADILVRAERSRRRKVKENSSGENSALLWEKMENEEVAATVEIHIPRQGKRKARTATAEVRYAPVTLMPPKNKSHLFPLSIWAVYILEKDSPDGISPIEWMLLTTVETKTAEDAVERMQWYVKRWGIEIYHRTLKSGCRIEDRQLNEADRIMSCLAIDMVVAWRIYHLTKLGQETPDLPCTEYFKDDEWKALVCFVKGTAELPEKPPSIGEFHRMLASLGGFLNRKCDGNPGIQTTRRGLEVLHIIKKVWRILAPNKFDNPIRSNIPQTGYG